MGSYLREGNDYMNCRNCGSSFDMNNPMRKDIPGGPFQPYCRRCANTLEEVHCITCASKTPIGETQGGYHTHGATNETEYCSVCSQECAIKLAVTDCTWDSPKLGATGEIEPPNSEEKLQEMYREESSLEDSEVYKETIKKKYIGLSAALYITQNYSCEAVLNTSLTPPDSEYLPLVVTPRRNEATTEYLSRFNRVSFPTPVGDYILKFDGGTQHQGFGVCLFEYEKIAD